MEKLLNSIKLRLGLKNTAQHSEYHAAIETADGRPVTSIHWMESLLPDRKSVETPEIRTSELPSGEYVLLLSGKNLTVHLFELRSTTLEWSAINLANYLGRIINSKQVYPQTQIVYVIGVICG